MRLFATTPFSMEKPVCQELMRLHLGYTDIREGRVYFESDGKGLARACVNLRGADRIFGNWPPLMQEVLMNCLRRL